MEISRQYSFINNENGFTISLIEGHALINDLNEIHNIGPNAIDFYKKTVLSSMQMINFLKPGESLGFYIDSDEPYYRFKIEISQAGTLRTLLLPEEFEEFPHHLNGKCRIHKIFAGKEPYTSILEFKDHPVENLMNEVLEKSYQTKSTVIVSDDCASSLMLTKLPASNMNKKITDFDDLSLDQIKEKYAPLINAALILPDANIKSLEELFSTAQMSYIGSKEVKFDCPCSHERMVENIFTLNKKDRLEIFDQKESIETRCDYCNSIYVINKSEIEKELH